jgi:hypothetical protein
MDKLKTKGNVYTPEGNRDDVSNHFAGAKNLWFHRENISFFSLRLLRYLCSSEYGFQGLFPFHNSRYNRLLK